MSDRELQSILDNSTAVIQVKDVDGRYLRINRRFEEIFGLDRSKILGKTDHELFPFRANDVEVMQTAGPLEFEETAPHQDGLQWRGLRSAAPERSRFPRPHRRTSHNWCT